MSLHRMPRTMLDHHSRVKHFEIAPNKLNVGDMMSPNSKSTSGDAVSHDDPWGVLSADHNISIESVDIRALSSPILRKMAASSMDGDEKKDDSNNEEEEEEEQGQQVASAPKATCCTSSPPTMADLHAQVEALQRQLQEVEDSNKRKDEEISILLKGMHHLKKKRSKQRNKVNQQNGEVEAAEESSPPPPPPPAIAAGGAAKDQQPQQQNNGGSSILNDFMGNHADKFIAEYLRGRLEKNQKELSEKTLNSLPQVREAVEETQRWLFTKGADCKDVKSLIIEYCNHCRSSLGIPVDRLSVSGMMFHNDVSAYSWKWEEGKPFEENSIPHAEWEQISNVRMDEPFAALWGLNVREYRMKRGEGCSIPSELSWFEEDEYHDYLALPVFHRGDYTGKIAWSTKRPGGFTKENVEIIRRIMTAVSTVLRLQTNEIVVRTLTGELEEKVAQQTQQLADANKDLAAANERVTRQYQNQLKHFAMMSHEIRTPLNCIIGLSNLLLDSDDLDEQSREQVDLIVGSSDLLLAVVNDVLDYSKLATGRVDTFIEPTNVRKIIHRVTAAVNAKAKENNLEIKERVHDDLPDLVLSDGRRIQQIMFNLLGNAVKFGKAGECVEFNVGVYPGNALGTKEYLKFSIKDYGKGISQEEMQNIFQPFQQSSANDPTHGGTGLGLAITRQLVRVLGGSISVESELGKWAEFVVKLPCVRPNQPEQRQSLITNLGMATRTSSHSINTLDDSILEDDDDASSFYSSMSSSRSESIYTSHCSSSQYGGSSDYSSIHQGYLNLKPVLFDTPSNKKTLVPAPVVSVSPNVSFSGSGNKSGSRQSGKRKSSPGKSFFKINTDDSISAADAEKAKSGSQQLSISAEVAGKLETTPKPLFPIKMANGRIGVKNAPTKSESAQPKDCSQSKVAVKTVPLFPIGKDKTVSTSDAGVKESKGDPEGMSPPVNSVPPLFPISSASSSTQPLFPISRVPSSTQRSNSPLFPISTVPSSVKQSDDGKTSNTAAPLFNLLTPQATTVPDVSTPPPAVASQPLFSASMNNKTETASSNATATKTEQQQKKTENKESKSSVLSKSVEKPSPSMEPSRESGTAPLFAIPTAKDVTITPKAANSSAATALFQVRAVATVPGCVVVEEESFDGVNILVAEDNLINQKVLQRTLKRIGIQGGNVTIVDNGQKAVDATMVSTFDIILMDLSMPVMDGLEATKIITTRRSEKNASYPKVVFLTAHALQDYKERASEAGGDGFISKPFKLETIKELIRVLRPPTK